MADRSRLKLVEKLTEGQFGLLKSITDEGAIDAAGLEDSIQNVVNDRLALSDGLLEAARDLRGSANAIARRSAVSRSYYAAYHAARATLVSVARKDQDEHEKLPREIDGLLGDGAGDPLKELRILRSEMDYSPYPGPNRGTRYDNAELETLIQDSIGKAETFVGRLADYRAARVARG